MSNKPVPSSNPSAICSATVSYKKKPGTLSLTKSALRWIPRDGPGAGGVETVTLAHGRLQSLFSSKDGGPKVMLRICAAPIRSSQDTNGGEPVPDENFNFTFVNPTGASNDREVFKLEISQIIAHNRNKKNEAATPSNDKAQGTPKNPSSELPRVPSNDEKGKSVDPLQDWRLKKRVLQNNPDLRSLHKNLVMSGQITEGDFWDGREELLYHEARLDSQKKGRSAQMVDPRPETTDGGETTISITPQMIKDIFEQYPVVQKAYNENVPPLNDQHFWTRYFRSKLFNRHRSSARQTGDAVKEDEIFDKYLGDDDDGIEPKNLNVKHVYKLIDLGATQEDHTETGNSSDWTMRAGTQRSSLPLMRRFNEHSQRLLDSSLGKIPERSAIGVIDGGDAGSRNYYEETNLEDLNPNSEPERITLNLQGQERYFQGAAGAPKADSSTTKRKRTAEEEEECIRRISDQVNCQFKMDLGKVGIHKKSIQQATRLMMENVTQKYNERNGLEEGSIPPNLLSQVISTHTITNEFLRQFWQSILPNQSNNSNQDHHNINNKSLTNEQRALKVQRMMNFLNKTNDRIQTLLDQADSIGLSHHSILNALDCTIRAVEVAKKFYRQRVE